jgi:formate dehydrogenase maturation protein FdhE
MRIKCSVCGATNEVIADYAVFDQKKETLIEANCAGCGSLLQNVTCFHLSVTLVED